MRKIDPPAHRVRPTLELCISRIQDENLKSRSESVADELDDGEGIYLRLAETAALYKIKESKTVGALSRDEMVALYDQRLSQKGHPAREVYDSLRAAAKFNICPICGHRQVASLDHYLPKSSHPLFAITPINLVPCCSDCNKAKLADVATNAATQTLHPYFDDFDDAVWLGARVIEATPPAVIFYPAAPTAWSKVKRDRAGEHFRKFGLAELYGSNAAQELAQISINLRELSATTGAEGVKAHLEAQVRSRAALGCNTWQTALYTALANSEWFWGGGHAQIAT